MKKTHKGLEQVISLACLQLKRDKKKTIANEKMKFLAQLVNSYQKLLRAEKETAPATEPAPEEASYYEQVEDADKYDLNGNLIQD